MLLSIGAFERVKSTHKFDVVALRVCMLNHCILTGAIVTDTLWVVLGRCIVLTLGKTAWKKTVAISEMLHRVRLVLAQAVLGSLALVRKLHFVTLSDLRIKNLAGIDERRFTLLLYQILDFNVVIELSGQITPNLPLVVQETVGRRLVFKLSVLLSYTLWSVLVEVVIRVLFAIFLLVDILISIW